MHPTEIIDRDSLRDDVPDFRPGDTVKVHVRVVEGNRERVQVFQGAVIRRQGVGRPRDLHRAQGQLRGGGGADLPGALADHRQAGGGHLRRRPPGQALLPAGPLGEGRQDQGEAGDPPVTRRLQVNSAVTPARR